MIGTLLTLCRTAFNRVSGIYYNVTVILEHIQRFYLHFRFRIGAHRTLINSVPTGFYPDFSMTELMRDVRLYGVFEPEDKIFALHGVFRRVGLALPPVDYKRSLNEIYYTTTLRLLKTIPKEAGALQIIALITGRKSGQPDDPHVFPS